MKEELFILESKEALMGSGTQHSSSSSETSYIYLFQLSNFHFFWLTT